MACPEQRKHYVLKKSSEQGFTIVELLIVIVVIAILAAIVTVAYNGIRQRAVTSALQSDLSSALTVLKLDHTKTSQYPATTAAANEGRGLTFSPDTTVSYIPESGSSSPQAFCMSISRNGYSYFITQDSQPAQGTCESQAPVPTYGDVVLADNPSAYWRFQNATGTSVADATSAGRTLTLSTSTGVGAPGLSGDAGDYSWNAPGTTGAYASIANASWQHVAPFTAEAIIRPDVINSYRAIVSHDGSSTRSWNLYLKDGKLLVYDFSVGGDVIAGSGALSAGQTYHVAITYEAGVTRLYLNGNPDGSKTGSVLRTTTNNMPFLVGASYAGTASPTFLFDGTIDEVAFYNTALSAARLKAHAQAAGL